MPKLEILHSHYQMTDQTENMQMFRSLVEFIGKNDTKINSLNDAMHLYQAAKKYEIPDLEGRCMKYIEMILNNQNVCKIYEFAVTSGKLELIEQCKNIVCWEISAVLTSDGFIAAKPETVLWIYKDEDLILESELELFVALEKWCQANMTNTQQYSENEASTSIRKALYNIRFLSLSANTFIEHVVPSELLTSDEKLCILSKIVSPTCTLQMPTGFSTETQRLMHNQERFAAEFERLLCTDIASKGSTQCVDCELGYEGFYIDHLLLFCPSTSTIDRDKMKRSIFKKIPQKMQIEKVFFETKPAYQKAICRYIKLNFNWIHLNENTFHFEN